MADEIRRVQHYTLDIENKAGSAARVLEVLRDLRVNLIALWGYAIERGVAALEVIPEDEEAFLEAAKSAGLALGEPKSAFFVSGTDRLGAVAETLTQLAQAKINVGAVQAVSDGRGYFGAVIYVAPSDVEKAQSHLRAPDRPAAHRKT
jgi:predicted amino acid-binding ACT domain protein